MSGRILNAAQLMVINDVARNYLLAEDVYEVTSDRYREGIASMTEVLQDEMRMSEAFIH